MKKPLQMLSNYGVSAQRMDRRAITVVKPRPLRSVAIQALLLPLLHPVRLRQRFLLEL